MPGRLFNPRLCWAQCFVECTFALLSGKWRILTSSLQLDEATVDLINNTAWVLHNSVWKNDSPNIEEKPQAAVVTPKLTGVLVGPLTPVF